MKKKYPLSLLLIMLCFGLFSQEVISVAGAYFENSNGSISMTTGESMTETYSTGSAVLTQGFQQSRLSVSTIYELGKSGILISVSPNPVKDLIYIRVNQFQDLNYQICTITGKIVKEFTLYSEETMLSFSELPAAVYFINFRQGTKPVQTFQIIKQQ